LEISSAILLEFKMSALTAGQAIVLATKSLHQIHNDIRSMIAAVDKSMEEKGWLTIPACRNKISTKLSNSLESGRWVIGSIFRFYLPSTEQSTITKGIGLHIELEPPHPFDEPVCLVVAAHFAKPITPAQMWDTWYRDSALEVFRAIGLRKDLLRIAHPVFNNKFWPSANQGTAFVVPLCELTGPILIEERIVGPALAASI
jgi:hypothetical protein